MKKEERTFGRSRYGEKSLEHRLCKAVKEMGGDSEDLGKKKRGLSYAPLSGSPLSITYRHPETESFRFLGKDDLSVFSDTSANNELIELTILDFETWHKKHLLSAVSTGVGCIAFLQQYKNRAVGIPGYALREESV